MTGPEEAAARARDAFAENLAALRDQNDEPEVPDPEPPPTTEDDS